MLINIEQKESSVKDGDYDTFPVTTSIKRIKIEPQAFVDEWIPMNFSESSVVDDSSGLGPVSGELKMPTNHIPNNTLMYTWYVDVDNNGNEKFKKSYRTDNFSWEIAEYYAH